MPTLNPLLNFFKLYFDIYSTEFSIYYQGRRKVTSGVGILSTSIVVLLMLSYSLYKAKILLEGTNFTTQMATVLKPINTSNPEMTQFNEYGFDFAIKLMEDPTPDLGRISLRKTRVESSFNEATNSNDYSFANEELELEICTLDNFNHTRKEETTLFGIPNTYTCLKNKSEMRMGGTVFSAEVQYLDLVVQPCVNSTSSNITCQPKDVQDRFFERQWLVLAVVSYYFDKDDQLNPIKSYLDDSIYFTMIPDQKIFSEVFVKLSEVKISPHLLPWSPSRIEQFPQVDKIRGHITSMGYMGTNAFVQVQIRPDLWMDIFSKDTYSATDFASDVGGLFNIIYGSGKLLVLVFIDTFLVQNLLKNLYIMKPNANKSGPQQSDRQFNGVDHQENSQPGSNMCLFDFTWADFLRRFLYCYNCRRIPVQRSLQNQKLRKQYLFQKGFRKVRAELDAVNIYTMMQELKAIQRALITQHDFSRLLNQPKMILGSDNELQACDGVDMSIQMPQPLSRTVSKKSFSKKRMTEAMKSQANQRKAGASYHSHKQKKKLMEGSKKNLFQEAKDQECSQDQSCRPIYNQELEDSPGLQEQFERNVSVLPVKQKGKKSSSKRGRIEAPRNQFSDN